MGIGKGLKTKYYLGERKFTLKKNFIVHLHNWVRLVFTSECAIFIAFAFMVGGGENGSVSCAAS